jgi:AraC-like DNA-binding protein
MDNTIENSNFFVENIQSCDLVVYQCGMEKCKPHHSYGPAVRDHFLIHFILEGQGTFYVGDKAYKLSKDEGFLICPDVITYYEADGTNPWQYAWVGFKGIKAKAYLNLANLTREKPIFLHRDSSLIRSTLQDMRKAAALKYAGNLRLQGLLSIFLSELIEIAERSEVQEASYKDLYIKKAMLMIETNYSRALSIEDMAKNLGLNRNYFSSLFKESLNISPQEYLIKYRVNKACELIKNRSLSISDISRSVGYSDALGFSKIFKKVKGCSPKQYREMYTCNKKGD